MFGALDPLDIRRKLKQQMISQKVENFHKLQA